jgi:hypothetical protein
MLLAHGWEPAPGISFPTEAEHEAFRPRPAPADKCADCRGPIEPDRIGLLCRKCAAWYVNQAPFGQWIAAPTPAQIARRVRAKQRHQKRPAKRRVAARVAR